MIRKIIDYPIRTAIFITAVSALAIFLITAYWDFVSSKVFPNTILGLYDKEFWENILVELHGIVLELAIVGVLIFWLDYRRTVKGEIQRQLEDLGDYASLDFPEVNVKKVGNLKRLNHEGVNNINVQNLTLTEMTLKDLIIEGSKMIGLKVPRGRIISSTFKEVLMRSSNFEGCTIRNTAFDKCSLLKSKFGGAICKGVSFNGPCLDRADFSNCNLQSANFSHTDLRGAKFEGSNIKQCSFNGAKNIDVNELAKAACLDYISIAEDKLEELVSLRNDIKYQLRRGRL